MVGFLMFSFVGCQKKAPQSVQDAFAEHFPEAKALGWDKESDNEWEVDFKFNGMEYSALFSSDGIWKETEHEIGKNEIPNEVYNSIKSIYPNADIDEVELMESPKGVHYEMELETSGEVLEVILDSSGTILSKKDTEDEDEENDDPND